MNKTIAIITDVRYRMSLALMRDLKEAGVYIVAVEHDDSTPPLGFFSKAADECHMLSKTAYKDELLALCRKISEENGLIPALMPVGAKTLSMLCSEGVREEFEECCGICVPEKDSLELLNDKERLHSFAGDLAIPLPEEFTDLSAARFPCVVKPLCGERYGIKAADRYVIAEDAAQLDAALEKYDTLCSGDGCVVQEYLPGKGFGCSVAALNGRVYYSICHERIREYPVSGGPSACCRSVHIDEIKEYAESIVKALDFSGIAMFEFKQSASGEYCLLECNPRVWGSYPLTRASGSSFAQVWLQLCLTGCGYGFEAEIKDYKDVKMHYLLSDLRAGISYIKSGKPGKGLMAFSDTLNPAVKGGLLEFSDIKPALKYLGRAFK